MRETSRTSKQKTSLDLNECISLPASGSGTTPYALPTGQPVDLFGQAVVPVSHSRRRGKAKGKKTNDISGPCSWGSSASASLQRSLARMLVATLDVNGSPEYDLTWKRWVMRSGVPICRLRALARHTSDRDYSGWPTTRSTDGEKGIRTSEVAIAEFKRKGISSDLPTIADLAGWPTPDANSFGTNDCQWQERREKIKAQRINGNGFGLTLGMAATLANLAQNNEQSSNSADSGRDASEPLLEDMPPTAQVESGYTNLAGWPTPMSGSPTTEEYNEAGNTDSSRKVVELVSGPTSSLCSVVTKRSGVSHGVLNPAFSLWLMGFPMSWLACFPMTHSRSRRRKSPAAPGC